MDTETHLLFEHLTLFLLKVATHHTRSIFLMHSYGTSLQTFLTRLCGRGFHTYLHVFQPEPDVQRRRLRSGARRVRYEEKKQPHRLHCVCSIFSCLVSTQRAIILRAKASVGQELEQLRFQG